MSPCTCERLLPASLCLSKLLPVSEKPRWFESKITLRNHTWKSGLGLADCDGIDIWTYSSPFQLQHVQEAQRCPLPPQPVLKDLSSSSAGQGGGMDMVFALQMSCWSLQVWSQTSAVSHPLTWVHAKETSGDPVLWLPLETAATSSEVHINLWIFQCWALFRYKLHLTSAAPQTLVSSSSWSGCSQLPVAEPCWARLSATPAEMPAFAGYLAIPKWGLSKNASKSPARYFRCVPIKQPPPLSVSWAGAPGAGAGV